MRLTEHQQNLIKQKVTLIFGDKAQVYLFGSRTDDNAKGGDIDLFIELTAAISQPVLKTLQLNGELQQDFGFINQVSDNECDCERYCHYEHVGEFRKPERRAAGR